MSNELDRREMLKTLAAGGAAGIAGCYTQSDQESTKDVMAVSTMTNGVITEIEFAQSKEDLDEPDTTPALAFTAEEGWVFHE